MLEYVQFFHDVLMGQKNENKKKEMIKSLILSEARINHDLAKIIQASMRNDEAFNPAPLLNQFETNSFEVLASLFMSPADLFGDKACPSEEALSDMDKSDTSKKLFESKTDSELYEFYVRKCRVLAKLGEAESVHNANIQLKRRIKNIEQATWALIN